ncbi:maleylpyruvate isomerase family mycothiol-dependent enzyme [Arthrobacter sp. NA-172]|uniref:maleylpyruvate isomerase family mycothiol-dependent enzyme n=1 Tax=Arthrobacter sp. NA-172 TaxID=3367524 RepID=UPI003754786F
MSPDRYISELSTFVHQLSTLARQTEAQLTRSVPTCPGWSLDGLFGHIGSIERWAAEIVRHGRYVEQSPAPSSGGATWFLEGANAFLEAIEGVDPEKECWNFGPPPRKAGFWLQRQAHEHAIHLVDACLALEAEAPGFERDFMIDGIDEVLAMFAPRQLRLGRMPQPEAAVTFEVPEAGSWTLGQGPVGASITAPLHSMYLGLWGRSNLAESAVIQGDVSLAFRIMEGPITP